MGLARHALFAAALTAALAAGAAPAVAADYVDVQSGTLVYTSADNPQEDWVTVTAGNGAGKVVLTESRTPTGGPGPGCVAVSGQPAVLCSGVTALELHTVALADRVTIDVALPASVEAGDGNDLVTGGPAGDTLAGGLGADTIDGRGGSDAISGGSGDDILEARDGAADTINCGDGADTVHADPEDTLVACETVDQPAISVADPPFQQPDEPAVPPVDPAVDPAAGSDETAKRTADPVVGGDGERRIRSAPGADVDGDGIVDDRDGDGFADPGQGLAPVFDFAVAPGLKGPVRLVTRTVTVSSAGIATFEVACAMSEPAPCAGDLFVDPARKAKKGRRAARVRALMARRGRLGRSPFVIAQGKRHNLDVKLSAPARKALGLPSARRNARASRRGRSLRARVTVIQKGKRAQTTVVTLRGGA